MMVIIETNAKDVITGTHWMSECFLDCRHIDHVVSDDVSVDHDSTWLHSRGRLNPT